MPSVSNWIKSYPDFEDLHLEIFGICGRFMKNGKFWIPTDKLVKLRKLYLAIRNLRIPKLRKRQLSQFGTCKFQITGIFQLMHFCI